MSVIGALPLPYRHAQLATSQVMDHIFQPHAQHKKSFFSFLRSFRSSSFSCPTKHSPLFKKANKMISARKLIKLARKWQKLAAIKRKRITFSSTSSMVEKGHFVVYSADEKRFMLPLEYLKNEIVMELFNLTKEEFGIPSNGHLKLPFDSTFMEYAIELIKRKASKEVEKALIMSINMSVIGALPLPYRHAQLATSQVMDHIFQPHGFASYI
ncbi:hypothetical protein GOBAR_AA11912 [Gossypium barbadense]|uniref:Uncharacterized protein n=1 Tax=Gossypium barbadense TaxID=3634 RepID=A0A2P5XZG5_GOSBA|nr:hypothetical protein GOBAR_AA11912 [Gossypium barbadense]